MILKSIFTLIGLSTFFVILLLYSLPVSASGCIRANPSAQTDMVRISSSHDTLDHLPNFYATIRNNDSPDCGLSTFDIEVNAPLDWDQSIIPYVFDLKPGESKSVKLFLKPTAETKKGTYPILLIINNWTARFIIPRIQSIVNYSFEVTDDPKPGPSRTPAPLQTRNMKYTIRSTVTPSPLIYPSPSTIPTIATPIQQNEVSPINTKANQFSVGSWWNTFLQLLLSFTRKRD